MATYEGDIGFVGCGDYPIRRPEENLVSSSPSKNTMLRHQRVQKGSSKSTDWIGFIEGKDLPRSWNPSVGYIINANSKLSHQNVRYGVGSTAVVTPRAAQIKKEIDGLLETGRKVTSSDIFRIQ